MKRLYHQLMHCWGEAADILVFDARDRDPSLAVVHVAVWDATEDGDVTIFNTMGMSERRMPGADYFTEVNLGIRGAIEEHDRRRLAAFLANVAEYPFCHARKLDWWERLSNPGNIPCFPGCTQLLLTPCLTDGGFSRFNPPDEEVKLLYATPTTSKENHILTVHGRQAFLDYLIEHELDLFAPRTDPTHER